MHIVYLYCSSSCTPWRTVYRPPVLCTTHRFEDHLVSILRGVDPDLDPTTLPATAQHHISAVNGGGPGSGSRAALRQALGEVQVRCPRAALCRAVRAEGRNIAVGGEQRTWGRAVLLVHRRRFGARGH